MFHTIPNYGSPSQTVRVACGNVAANLSAIFTNAAGAPAIGALVSVESNNVRFTLGGNIATPTGVPTQGATGLGHLLVPGQSIMLTSGRQVRTFQHINATNGSNAVLQVTLFFEVGR